MPFGFLFYKVWRNWFPFLETDNFSRIKLFHWVATTHTTTLPNIILRIHVFNLDIIQRRTRDDINSLQWHAVFVCTILLCFNITKVRCYFFINIIYSVRNPNNTGLLWCLQYCVLILVTNKLYYYKTNHICIYTRHARKHKLLLYSTYTIYEYIITNIRFNLKLKNNTTYANKNQYFPIGHIIYIWLVISFFVLNKY